jgi:hypothetical protein
MDIVGNDVNTLYEEKEYLVGYLVGNDVNTLHEEKIHIVEFNFIRVIDARHSVVGKKDSLLLDKTM